MEGSELNEAPYTPCCQHGQHQLLSGLCAARLWVPRGRRASEGLQAGPATWRGRWPVCSPDAWALCFVEDTCPAFDLWAGGC